MRVFLRNKRTGLYYRGSNQQSSNPREALEFASVAAAAMLALSERLPETEIALRCDPVAQEVGLPVLAEWCELDEHHRLPPNAARLCLSLPPKAPAQ